MAGEAQGGGQAPAAAAAQAMGGAMMMDEISPFQTDDTLPDHSDDIASIFGLGEEAGPTPNSPEGAQGGGASPPQGASAAEGGQGQAQPATPATSTQPGQQGTSPQPPAQPEPAPAAPAPAAPPAAPAQGQSPAPTQDPTVQALTAQVQALTAHIASLQAQQGQQGAGQQTPQNGQLTPEQQQLYQNPLLNYQLAMPDDVAAAVFNEDPAIARQGLQHVINAVARETHVRVLRQVDELVNQRLQSYGQQTTVQSQQERMRQEYFQSFPNHNDPATQLIVAQEAQVMFADPTVQWNENTRNALGARVNARLGYAAQQPQQQQPFGQQPAPAQGQPVPQPAAQLGASPRPAASAQDNDSNFIESVLTA